MSKTLQDNLTRQLCDSVEQLQKQVEKVEFWASAVTGLAAPVPDYQPEDTAVARYVKPGRLPRKRKRRRSRSEGQSEAQDNASGGVTPASA